MGPMPVISRLQVTTKAPDRNGRQGL